MRTLILALSFSAGALVALAVMLPSQSRRALERLRELRRYGPLPGGPVTIEEEELVLSFSQRVLKPLWEEILRHAAGLLPQRIQEQARLRLAHAGVQMDAGRFVGLQATAATAGAVIAAIVSAPIWVTGGWGSALLIGALGTAVGWRIPGLSLLRLARQRRRAMERSLPDVLDLLSVSVEAGLGFDGAVQKVAEKFAEPVAGEFREFLKEVRLGRPRSAALRDLADRSGVPDFQSFAAAVIQADQLGVSIARVLKSQAEGARARRRQRVEERAMQLPLKLLFPLIFFIFPTLFIVILGPLVLQFATLFRD